MPAKGKAPPLKIKLNVGDSSTPAHLEYHTRYIETKTPRFAIIKGRTDGVMVTIGEWDWQHSAVYLGIHSRFKLDNGCVAEGAFEDPISLDQLDQIIEMFTAARAKAKELGILTPDNSRKRSQHERAGESIPSEGCRP